MNRGAKRLAGEPDLGVSIAAFRSEKFIADCLTSLFACQDAKLRVVVVDNASDDRTSEVVRDWAAKNSGRVSFAEGAVGQLTEATADLTLLRSPINGGFAYATNRGLELLLGCQRLDLFWVLNPDCEPLPGSARALIEASREGPFALLGGRTLYRENPGVIQSDGGCVSLLTGTCRSVHSDLQGEPHAAPCRGHARLPDRRELRCLERVSRACRPDARRLLPVL